MNKILKISLLTLTILLSSAFVARAYYGEPPPRPTGVHITGVTKNSISLAWNNPGYWFLPVTYTIYHEWNGPVIGTTSNFTFTDTNLNSSTNYTYYINASDTDGDVSQVSLVVSSTTLQNIFGIPTSVPTASTSGMMLISTTTGQYIATSSPTILRLYVTGTTTSPCFTNNGTTCLSNYFSNSGATTSLTTGTVLQAPAFIASSTTATSTFAGSVTSPCFSTDGTSCIQGLTTAEKAFLVAIMAAMTITGGVITFMKKKCTLSVFGDLRGAYVCAPDWKLLDLSKSDIMPNTITITSIDVDCSVASPTTQLTGKIKYCDALAGGAFPGANPTDIRTITTTSGNYSSGAITDSVPAGKIVYLAMSADPTDYNTTWSIIINYTIN